MAVESLTQTSHDSADSSRSRWDAPPSLLFHAALAVPLTTYVWSQSFPGFDFATWGLSIAVVLLLGFGWLVWLIIWRRRSARRREWCWGIAPAMVISSVLLTASGVPLNVRFELNRSDFDEIVQDLEPAGSFNEWARLQVPDHVGSYEIDTAYQVGPNVILYEHNGAFLDDAGFAYLPEGPDERLGNGGFEAPSFRRLRGDWYAWTASW